MTSPVIEPSWASGELAPALYGRVDAARWHNSAATMRNMFVNTKGGAYSRAGTAFVGFSANPGFGPPPRLIPFQFSISQGLVLEFGAQYMRVIINGSYVTEGNAKNIAAITRANPGVLTVVSHGYSTGDFVALGDIPGMPQLSDQIFLVHYNTVNSFYLTDIFGSPIDTSAYGAYVGGGQCDRLYTLPTPYVPEDLQYLKYTQSADVMTLCCSNPTANREYAPHDLSRIADNDWTLVKTTFAETVDPPPSAPTITPSTTGAWNYAYVITAVNPVDGSESIGSAIGRVGNAVDIAATAGTMTINWDTAPPVTDSMGNSVPVKQYNVYKAEAINNADVPDGAQFGYAGTAFGVTFTDSNIVPDFTQVPPQHANPFAKGAIVGLLATAPGTGYTNASVAITSGTGSGAVIVPVIQSGGVVAYIIENPGENYVPGDTAAISGDGTGATADLVIGPQSGVYPAVPAYFQERRIYANTFNNPDTYFLSQPGLFTNFDARTPTIDSDAITGTPWSVQVNGIQFMVSMPGGLVVLTGLSAWQLTGAGGSSLNPQPLTPANQQAQPQAYNGCNATVPPIRIDYDILYVQAKGSVYRDLAYQFFTNIYTGTDLTLNSTHLFLGYTIKAHGYAEEPWRIVWSVRTDGVLLSLTYLKPEQIAGWARHDTNGFFQSVCSVTELPVDAPYFVVQRVFPGGIAYSIERMDNRIWAGVEDCWCVDMGRSIFQFQPSSSITASSPTGAGAISGVTLISGGTRYSAGTTAVVIDEDGNGSGATIHTTVSGGVLSFFMVTPGSLYTRPRIEITDPAGSDGGSGASAKAILDNSATFVTAVAVFGGAGANVGDVIRMGGGQATITTIVSSVQCVADITVPIAVQRVDNGSPTAKIQPSGNWSVSRPVSTIYGLMHLRGMSVTGLIDGQVLAPRTVAQDGSVTLPFPATSVVIGLGYQCQFQSVYLDAGEPTVQGQRKAIKGVTVRLERSRDVKVGCNQVDGQALSPPIIAPRWSGLGDVPNLLPAPYDSNEVPLWTGDVRVVLQGGFNTHGQVALQQDNPLPMQVLALIPDVLSGDTPSQMFPNRQKDQQQGGRQ